MCVLCLDHGFDLLAEAATQDLGCKALVDGFKHNFLVKVVLDKDRLCVFPL
jgi:hypothetical protein